MSLQKKLRTEVIQLEDTLAQVRKEYEMLRIEFEQNLAANEQAGNVTDTSNLNYSFRLPCPAGEVGFLSGEFPKARLLYSNHDCSEEVCGGGVSCHHFSDCSVLAGVHFLSKHHEPRRL